MSAEVEIEAGQKLDMLVAEKVLGWKPGRRYGNGNGEWIFPEGVKPHFRGDYAGTPRFSTDIAAAYQMEERIKELGREVEYANTLARLLSVERPATLFDIAHASAEIRCRAALEITR